MKHDLFLPDNFKLTRFLNLCRTLAWILEKVILADNAY